ncbi:MAG: hypothetical protein JW395_3104 [Nitrospira sp.]|nr:hypothetical protein [Nitrospira sp.]
MVFKGVRDAGCLIAEFLRQGPQEHFLVEPDGLLCVSVDESEATEEEMSHALGRGLLINGHPFLRLMLCQGCASEAWIGRKACEVT